MIRPVPVTDAILTSSTVPETVAATWSGATTYALGDRAGPAPVDGQAQIVYESLQNGNLNHAQASLAPWWKVVATVYPAYSGAVAYAANDIVSSIGADSHLLYQSVQAANTGHSLTDTAWWLPYGATNRWSMFDSTYGTQTSEADAISCVFTPGALITGLYLGNLDAFSARLVQSVSGYDQTILLQTHDVLSWYDYWYEPLLRVAETAFVDIPPYPASTLTLTVTNTGSTAKCGVMVMGASATIGLTQWEATGGLLSFSNTATDRFGNTTFNSLAKTKRLNLDVRVTPGLESEAHRLLTLYSDMPMVFIGSTRYSMLVAYGFLGSWNVPITNKGKNASIEIKGLT